MWNTLPNRRRFEDECKAKILDSAEKNVAFLMIGFRAQTAATVNYWFDVTMSPLNDVIPKGVSESAFSSAGE
jgi:hypothetical protein